MNEQSFMKSLFHGVIAEELVCPFPEVSREERDNTNLLLEGVRKFIEENVDSARIDRERAIPASVLEGMKHLGLFGMNVPQEYGGIGLSCTSYTRVMQEVAGFDASLAVTLGAHQSIGLKGLLLFGTEEQKRKYLPGLASGENVAAFALTEAAAGADVAAIQTRAELAPDGSGYVLDG
jgi:acyl-CoA dehydrogenase family protein 9